MNYRITINNNDYSSYTVLPIKTSKLLDERLDEAVITLKRVEVASFEPLTKIELTIDDETETFLVAEDESLEVPVGSGKYNHTLYLVEETKDLEGIVCDALVFTNELGTNFDE